MSCIVRDFAVAAIVAVSLAACSPESSAREASAPIDRTRVIGATAATVETPPVPAGTMSEETLGDLGDERSARRVVLNGIDLTGVGYDKGSPTAPIVMVDFSDFGCPYCGSHARQTLPSLEREFIATRKVFYKYVPLVMGMFPNGNTAARAAECAADEGKFWPMHDRLYAGQQEWRKNGTPTPVYRRYARELGIDAERFTACLADGRTESRTKRASAVAQSLGIRATPTFTIDGQGIEGALPLDVFQKMLREKSALLGEAAHR